VVGVVLAWAVCADAGPVLYVDHAAIGANNGSSWQNAYVSLQSALTAAQAPGSGVTEIRVADGTYRPAGPGGSRAASFALVQGVTLKGGYAGVSAANPDQRNAVAFPTILSGDLNADDDTVGNTENSNHVVTAASGLTAATVIDGFIITGGNGQSGQPAAVTGGGISITGGSPTVRNCIFRNNIAQQGGGAYSSGGTPRFVNCLFYANTATLFGGAIRTAGAVATYVNCTVTENTANQSGGGLSSVAAATVIVSGIFWNNTPEQINFTTGTPVVSKTCIENLPAVFNGNGNIATNPSFVSAAAANFRLQGGSPCENTGENNPVGGLSATDLDGSVRLFGSAVDMGAYERAGDCNLNGIGDNLDLTGGAATDCGDNGIIDVCEIASSSTAPGGPFYCTTNCAPDCNNNGVPDACEPDCNGNGIADECDIDNCPPDNLACADCNGDGVPDGCSPDCNENGTYDVCDIFQRPSDDCNDNALLDDCEIATGSTAPGGPFFCDANCDPDCDNNGIPDACDPDCNENDVPDGCDIINLDSSDCIPRGSATGNGVPDECEIDENSTAPGGPFYCTRNCSRDCNNDGVPDGCQVDCNFNNVPDDCDVDAGRSPDCDGNGVPDECQTDSDGDGVINSCDNCPSTAPGVPVRPDGCEQFGACCLATGFCLPSQQFAGACLAFPGAVFLGDGTTCQGDPDGDQVTGCADRCPFDSTKVQPGICGCGLSDAGAQENDPDCHGPSPNPLGNICRINSGQSGDCNENELPDECEIDQDSTAPGIFYCTADCADDCNNNGVPDECEIDENNPGPFGPYFCKVDCLPDCNLNGILDLCDLNDDTSEDCDGNNVPDECQPDGDGDGTPDACDPCNGDDILIGGICDHPGDPDPCETGELDCSSGVLICTDGPAPDDQDGDGVFDCHDQCPDTAPGSPVDAAGCPLIGGCCYAPPNGCFDGLSRTDCEVGVGGEYLGNGSTCPCRVYGTGDCDGDNDTDIDDYGLVMGCLLTLAGAPVTSPCDCADIDNDGRVDLRDLSLFQADAGECVNDCPVCPRGIYAPGGDCCDRDGNGTAGCDQVPGGGQAFFCCEAVCQIDATCCNDGWDDACARTAIQLFPEECGCPPVAEACCLEEGSVGRCADLTPTDCIAQGGFPQLRADRFTSCAQDGNVCDGVCPTGLPTSADCCSPPEGRDTPGCRRGVFPTCCNAVCDLKPSCCFGRWGPECVRLAETLTACNCPKVACCGESAAVAECANLTRELCTQSGGFPQEAGTDCADSNFDTYADDCLVECPVSGTSCCGGLSGLPGCTNTSCCEDVCALRRSCCEVAWDAQCVLLAVDVPACSCSPLQACCAPGFTDNCRHVPDNPTGSTICAAELSGVARGSGTDCEDLAPIDGIADDCFVGCPPGATGDCCSPAGLVTPGCEDEACCNAVCAIDLSCCDTQWDFECAARAANTPECNCQVQPCGPASGDCCDPNNTGPGCNNVPCCELVCGVLSDCCTGSWSDFACNEIAFGFAECNCP